MISSYPYRLFNLLSSAFAPQEPSQDQQTLVGQADAGEEWPMLQEQTGQDPDLREYLPGAREYIVHPPSRVAYPENQQQDHPQPDAGSPQRRSGRYHYVRDNMGRWICAFPGADGQPCKAAYYSHTGLCKHYQVNHELKKPYPCQFCGRSLLFSTRAQYTKHMKRAHSA